MHAVSVPSRRVVAFPMETDRRPAHTDVMAAAQRGSPAVRSRPPGPPPKLTQSSAPVPADHCPTSNPTIALGQFCPSRVFSCRPAFLTPLSSLLGGSRKQSSSRPWRAVPLSRSSYFSPLPLHRLCSINSPQSLPARFASIRVTPTPTPTLLRTYSILQTLFLFPLDSLHHSGELP